MSNAVASTSPHGWTVAEKAVAIAILLVGFAGSIATSWSTSQSQLNQKVDRAEYQADREQVDRRFTRDSMQLAVEAERWRRVEIGVDSANLRLRQIWCEGKSSSCR